MLIRNQPGNIAGHSSDYPYKVSPNAAFVFAAGRKDYRVGRKAMKQIDQVVINHNPDPREEVWRIALMIWEVLP